ncbi:hypothetical protein PICMEDRAFT_15241 [Pichia membranifaciens NRRL Y-2026]|uniref:pyridoxal kinase n=1 Tax=Pichia membranifaciens NRRL Y-2026 TaxID=763406 RepID=A0A1E3NMA1_9ASCO|nr:hypothetical protein PICMEDRAFT_15241 [Pichia membranifaciens NRRL Y-2026]ODQ47259.1 hypothetical protein PICMEDRAFT_15241 [Pichia membranifaciens NRRL Y-2026]
MFTTITPVQNILSISSHVVHGNVGNDAIQFPLNLRNWNVDCINTTNLSAHPGHGVFTGGKEKAKLVGDLFQGLKELLLDDEYQAVIIGYVASSENLQVIWNDILTQFTRKNVVKVMDPVIGDNGKVYVSQEIVDLYLELLGRNEIDIDLLTPNMFEIEVLTGIKINSWETVKKSIDVFCAKYMRVKNLVITSVTIDGKMYCVGSSKGKSFYYKVSEVDAIFSGSGDLFLALLTDELVKNEQVLAVSVCKTINVVTDVLNMSYQLLKDDCTTKRNANGKLYIPDLKLVESKNILVRDVEVIEPTYLN